MDGMVREDHFVITVASEIMAYLCLADDLEDLKKRLGRIIVAYTFSGEPVTADQLHATGCNDSTVKGCDQAEYYSDSGTIHRHWYTVARSQIWHMAATVYVQPRWHLS